MAYRGFAARPLDDDAPACRVAKLRATAALAGIGLPE